MNKFDYCEASPDKKHSEAWYRNFNCQHCGTGEDEEDCQIYYPISDEIQSNPIQSKRKPGRPKADPTKPIMLRLTVPQHKTYMDKGGARWIKRLLDEKLHQG